MVDNLFEGNDKLPGSKKPELRKILIDYGYSNSHAGVYCRFAGSGSHNLMEWDVNTGKEGYTYIKTLNGVQQQDLVTAIEQNETTEDGESQVFSVVGRIGVAALGIGYAVVDGPFSFYVALASLALFFYGTRIIPGFFTVDQFNEATKRFKRFNPVTDQKEAITRALSDL